jgi:hypothetical protein
MLFGSVIEARWSRPLPRSENRKIPIIFTSQREVKSQNFPTVTKQFLNKPDTEVMEKYCRFLLGAYKECMTKYAAFKLRKVQEKEEKPFRGQTTSTTSSPLISTSEKVPGSRNKKLSIKFTHQTKAKSQAFPSPTKKFQNNLDKETMEKYCRFLLGAYEECMAKYGKMKERKVQENEEKQHRGQKISTTPCTLIDTNEKVYVRI